jgi:2-isopropylmalate synthase
VRSNTLTDEDIQAIEQLSSSAIEKGTTAQGVSQQKVDVEKLEKRVEAL